MEENIYRYDQETIRCLAGFETLWQRVAGQPAAASFSDDDALRQFISRETCAAREYAALARMFQSHTRTLLTAHCHDANRRSRRLTGEYFIRTGQRCHDAPDCDRCSERLSSLRHLYECGQALSRDYENASKQTGCPVLKELYSRFSVETAERATALRALILDCF